MPVSIDRRTVSTLCAPLGGLRPGTTKLAPLLCRLRAPGLGVQACGPVPLTAQAPKCSANLGAPVGCRFRSIRMQKPGGRRGSCAAAGSGRRKEKNAVQLSGGYPGGPPPGHALWVLSLVQEKVPRPPVREPAKAQGLPELPGERTGFCLLFSREKSNSPSGETWDALGRSVPGVWGWNPQASRRPQSGGKPRKFPLLFPRKAGKIK